MRLDKFLSDMNMGTRTELKRDIRKGAVQVNGEKITDPGFMVNENDEIVGLYILHPNNIGRCGHICKASYAVKSTVRGQGVGKAIVTDCLGKAKEIGFRVIQFNAVVKSNTTALKLYQKLGFTQLGTIPGGFLNKDGVYEDIIVHYKEL